MFVALALIFIVAPVIEILVIVQVAHAIGGVETLVVMALLCCTGAWVLRVESLESMRKVRAALQAGRMPAAEVLDALLVFIAGVLLVLPGFVSAAIGLLLVIPPLRSMARRLVQRGVEAGIGRRVRATGFGTVGGVPAGSGRVKWASDDPVGGDSGRRPSGSTGQHRRGPVIPDDVIDLDGEEVWFVDVRGEIEAAAPEPSTRVPHDSGAVDPGEGESGPPSRESPK